MCTYNCNCYKKSFYHEEHLYTSKIIYYLDTYPNKPINEVVKLMVEVTEPYKNIIDVKPQFVMKISDITASKFLFNSIYAPLILILRKGPLTIPEIVDKYNEILKKDSDNKDSSKTAKDNTIYKYLKKLIEIGLVIETGAQIDLSKASTKTKTLYQLSSVFFLPDNENFNIFSSDIGNLIAEIIGVFLSGHFDDKFPDPAPLKDLLASYSKSSYDKFFNFIQSLENQPDNPNYQNALKSLHSLPGNNYFRTLNLFKFLIELLELSKNDLLRINPLFTLSESLTLKDTSIDLIDETDSTNTVIKNDQFKQQLVMPVNGDNWKKYFDDIVNASIFNLLRTKAMTVKQIFEKLSEKMVEIYRNECEMCTTYGKEKFPDEPTEVKSESTVWRHIKDLMDAGFLAEAGRLYSSETKTTQILYARTSKIYIHYYHDSDIFNTPEGQTILEALANFLIMYLNKTNVDLDKFKTAIINTFNAFNKALELSYRELKHNSVIDVTRNLKGMEFDSALHPISLAEFFIHSDELKSEAFISDLRNSFN